MDSIISDIWKASIIIPILKALKDHSLASNYRPISFTSYVCKLLERMINYNQLWIVEKWDLLANILCGFSKHRSTADHLVLLFTQISNSFVLWKHLVSGFFNLEKAYDTALRYRILCDLHSWGFRGYLPMFIEQFFQIDSSECGKDWFWM